MTPDTAPLLPEEAQDILRRHRAHKALMARVLDWETRHAAAEAEAKRVLAEADIEDADGWCRVREAEQIERALGWQGLELLREVAAAARTEEWGPRGCDCVCPRNEGPPCPECGERGAA